jgi:hypothetical protein
MSFTLRKYYQTIEANADGETLWNPPDRTVLWPTYFTLITAALTSIFSTVILMAYIWSATTAERIDDWRSRILLGLFLLKVALEITTSSGMYATGAHGPPDPAPQSLWYQTCTATPDIATLFHSVVNVPQFCEMQVSTIL